MSNPTIYEGRIAEDHIGKLYKIASLAKVGAAATDTALNLERMEDAHCRVYELIHELASQAIDLAETDQRKSR